MTSIEWYRPIQEAVKQPTWTGIVTMPMGEMVMQSFGDTQLMTQITHELGVARVMTPQGGYARSIMARLYQGVRYLYTLTYTVTNARDITREIDVTVDMKTRSIDRIVDERRLSIVDESTQIEVFSRMHAQRALSLTGGAGVTLVNKPDAAIKLVHSDGKQEIWYGQSDAYVKPIVGAEIYGPFVEVYNPHPNLDGLQYSFRPMEADERLLYTDIHSTCGTKDSTLLSLVE